MSPYGERKSLQWAFELTAAEVVLIVPAGDSSVFRQHMGGTRIFELGGAATGQGEGHNRAKENCCYRTFN